MEFYHSLTDFIFVENEPEPADVIFIPGGPHGEIALTAARLYHEGYAKVLIPSGRYSKLKGAYTDAASPPGYQGHIFSTEADFLSQILIDEGVPSEAICPERNATFTYENAIYTRALTDSLGITVHTALLCCQAYHARRALMYYQVLYPDTRILVCPTETGGIRKSDWFQSPETIDLVLGEVERCGSQFHEILKKYPQIAISPFPFPEK